MEKWKASIKQLSDYNWIRAKRGFAIVLDITVSVSYGISTEKFRNAIFALWKKKFSAIKVNGAFMSARFLSH